jgi:hypothetical protein
MVDTLQASLIAFAHEGLSRKDLETRGNLYDLIVDLAVEVANNEVLESFSMAKQIGIVAITCLHQDLLLSADTACTVGHRSMQQLLNSEIASLNSSSTIDIFAAAAEHPSGTLPLNTHVFSWFVNCR